MLRDAGRLDRKFFLAVLVGKQSRTFKIHRLLRGRGRCYGYDPLFKLFDDGEKISGFKWLDDNAVRFHAVRVFPAVRLHLADSQQHWRVESINGVAQLFADFQAAVTGHVDIEDDEVRFVFRNFLERGRAIADGHDFIPGFRQNFCAHVLGRHAVISK